MHPLACFDVFLLASILRRGRAIVRRARGASASDGEFGEVGGGATFVLYFPLSGRVLSSCVYSVQLGRYLPARPEGHLVNAVPIAQRNRHDGADPRGARIVQMGAAAITSAFGPLAG